MAVKVFVDTLMSSKSGKFRPPACFACGEVIYYLKGKYFFKFYFIFAVKLLIPTIIKYEMLDLIVAISPPVAALIAVTVILCSFYKYEKLWKAEPESMAWATGDSDLFRSAHQRGADIYTRYEDSEPDLEEALLGQYHPDYYRGA